MKKKKKRRKEEIKKIVEGWAAPCGRIEARLSACLLFLSCPSWLVIGEPGAVVGPFSPSRRPISKELNK